MMPKDVCVAFLGFDSDRIYIPMEKLKCDKIYIIRRGKDEAENAAYNYGRIVKRLGRDKIVDRIAKHDVFHRINCIKQIFEEEKECRIFVNVSCGSKLDAISGMLGVMLFKKIPSEVIPFYAHPKGSGRDTRGKDRKGEKKYYSETRGIIDIQRIPILDIQSPDPSQLTALELVSRNGGSIRKKELVEKLCELGCIEGYSLRIEQSNGKKYIMHSESTSKEKTRNAVSGALHAAENRIFRDLKTKWKAISEEDRVRNKKIQLTENGQHLVMIFFGLE